MSRSPGVVYPPRALACRYDSPDPPILGLFGISGVYLIWRTACFHLGLPPVVVKVGQASNPRIGSLATSGMRTSPAMHARMPPSDSCGASVVPQADRDGIERFLGDTLYPLEAQRSVTLRTSSAEPWWSTLGAATRHSIALGIRCARHRRDHRRRPDERGGSGHHAPRRRGGSSDRRDPEGNRESPSTVE